ncbi:hypothetical protein DSO57_1032390 [Entomophthora muscae]|uniref:Uncharacterized protein n=1 Tax=Entomophthora muscae TaxID=34485 RepID=A0ACC2S2S9_9FUNG|nr:hypothetical protein DSO57_1032390 [Entomophthora muscae]
MSQVQLTLSGISAGCSLVVVLLAVLLRIRKQQVVHRLSVQLQVGICAVELLKNLGLLSSNGVDGMGCAMLGFVNLFMGHTYLLLNISLALNAHWVLLRDYPPKAGWKLWFWATPLLSAAFLNVPLLAWDLLGTNEAGMCFIKQGNVVLEFVYIHGFYTAGVVYCLTTCMLVLHKLKKSPHAMLVLQLNLDPTGQKRMLSVLRDVARTMPLTVSFSLVLCVSILFCNICMLVDFVTDANSPFMFSWGYFGFNTIGMLNLLAFLSDPLVRRALVAPSLGDAQEYDLHFGTKPAVGQALDSDSEYGIEVAADSLSWADKQCIQRFINST